MPEKSPYENGDALAAVESNVQGSVAGTHLTHQTTHRNIKSRQAQMIVIAGAIGTGLFVGSGEALAVGGPALLLVCYLLMSLFVYGIITLVTEMAVLLPVPGSSMAAYAKRYVSPSCGFALGWLYWYSFAIVVGYEITAASLVINFWPNSINIGVWITIMLVIIIGMNLFPVGVYAESEFWFSSIKLIMMAGLLILSFVLCLGGGPNHERLGFHYWRDPGAVNEYLTTGASGRWTAFLYVLVFSGFSFYFSPEQMVIATGEMRSPRKTLPTASRRFFLRMIFFYILGALAIGVVCPSNAPDLTQGSAANASPFVIAIRLAGIKALPSVINAGVLTSAWSAGNSYLYMSSRALFSLANDGNAPAIFARCTRRGVPIYAVCTSSVFALLAYLGCGTEANKVFNYLVSLTNTAGYTSWTMCCFIYLRFRQGTIAQGIDRPYKSWTQPWAARICGPIFFCLLMLNGFTVFYPGQFTVAGFLTTYLGIPIFAILWVGHKLIAARSDPWLLAPEDMDFETGRAEVEADCLMFEEQDRRMAERRGNAGGNKALNFIKAIWE